MNDLLTHPGKAYFCLKVHDSRLQEWRFEQRFDKLFEALDLLCRFVEVEKTGTHKSPQQCDELVEALKHVPPPMQARFFLSPQTRVCVKRLADTVIHGLTREREIEGYARRAYEQCSVQRSRIERNLRDFNKAGNNVTEAARALLYLCVALRNCRFHAYAATSGRIVGHQALLEPFCEGFEEILLQIASGVFKMDRGDIEEAINDSGAVRGSELELMYDPVRGRLRLGFWPHSGTSTAVCTLYGDVIEVADRGDTWEVATSHDSNWQTLPIVSLGASVDAMHRVESRPFVDGRARIGAVTVDVSRPMAELWFTPQGATGNYERITCKNGDVTMWMSHEQSSPDSIIHPVPHLVGLSLPSERLVRFGRAQPAFTLRFNELK